MTFIKKFQFLVFIGLLSIYSCKEDEANDSGDNCSSSFVNEYNSSVVSSCNEDAIYTDGSLDVDAAERCISSIDSFVSQYPGFSCFHSSGWIKESDLLRDRETIQNTINQNQ